MASDVPSTPIPTMATEGWELDMARLVAALRGCLCGGKDWDGSSSAARRMTTKDAISEGKIEARSVKDFLVPYFVPYLVL